MLKNPYPGKFIVFEGPDGSGQTTQSSLLEKYISGLGKKVILTKEPTLDSKAGLEIKVILNHEKESTPEGLQKLFAEDRKEHLKKVIIPALKGGSIVISDRYFFSTFAFGSLGADLERLISINNDFILPDITFVMTVKPETSIERIANRGIKFTLFEKLESLKKVMENYKNLGNRFENMVFIDGDRAVNEIRKEIAEIALGIIR
ncbi:MAG: dTMP kinase [Candidatus Liptonbacteria bacterium RIFCSPLOWO2_01_FULL_45_15]|uniref:Thymidylate kinase n=1 Tax=Candidatus Liptonbacteria bacterium RIFCSPLOWO2_01_FULL_45_15 TaxID=1798649 RepID=A0A1G2CG92_9BACT|nr:MAG: dTMP kinase [Candidatus Liptonbacteria bacterium RIFCSPLOWO2_01_FULL_45_15]